MDFFNLPIHAWFALYKRDLPWRNTKDPYLIWLSEIILQQTRIDQGTSYFLKFANELPTVLHMANAPEDRILKLWQGLGYYSRARNMHASALWIAKHNQGRFPNNYKDILALKGVGEYTAAAIASISFNLEYPAVDGNVYRVLSRFFGIFEPVDTSKGKKIFSELAKELIKGTDPGMHNQAVMEFGALQCTPKKPDCSQCPVSEKCYAFANGKVAELPVKQNKTKQRERFFNYLIFSGQEYLYIRQRTGDDIWKNLYEFPMIETEGPQPAEALIRETEFGNLIAESGAVVIEKISQWKIHLLSHQRIHYRFIHVRPENDFFPSPLLKRVIKEDIFNFAVPRLLENYLNEYLQQD